MAAVVADSSGGNLERARVMVDDPDVAARVALWASVPDALQATGMTAAGLTRRVLESADRAVEPLRAAHAREVESLTAAAKEMGERGLPGRKEIVEQHQREERRFRTDALRAGLGVLARTYRDRVTGAVPREPSRWATTTCAARRRRSASSPRWPSRCRATPTSPCCCSRSSSGWRLWPPESVLAAKGSLRRTAGVRRRRVRRVPPAGR